MEKGLGIGSLVLAILAIFIPVIGIWLTIISATLAVFAVGTGFGLGIGAIIVNFINLLFLSPLVWAYLSTAPIISIFLIGVQVVALIILIKRNKKQVSIKFNQERN